MPTLPINWINTLRRGGGGFTPAKLEPKYWFDYTDPDTVTAPASKISAISNKGSFGGSAVQANATRQPVYVDNAYGSFDGVDNFLLQPISGVTEISQPLTIVAIIKMGDTLGTQWLVGSAANSCDLKTLGTTAQIVGGVPALTSMAGKISTDLSVFLGFFNGSDSDIYIDNVLAINGATGTEGMYGLSMGANGYGSQDANVDIFEVFLVDRELTENERTQIQTYVEGKYSSFSVTQAVGSLLQSGGAGSDSFIASAVLAESTWTEPVDRIAVEKTLPVNNKYLALGWADFFMEDATIILPLNAKYGFQSTHYFQPKPVSDDYLTSLYTGERLPNKIEKYGSYSGFHTYLHWAYTSGYPGYDGRNKPSNDELRIDRGDGSNEWGHPITDTVLDSFGLTFCVSYLRVDSTLYNKQWQSLSVSDCQEIRSALSTFMCPTDNQNNQKLLEGLDYLSNYYLGTTGTSVYNDDYSTRLPGTIDGSEPSVLNPILGGILQGATSTQNHEFWERILDINWRWKRDVEGVSRKDNYWTTSGGGSAYALYYTYGVSRMAFDNAFVDVEKTQINDGEAEFTSAVFGTRSYNDVLRSKGYKASMAAGGVGVRNAAYTGMARLETQRQYKKNGFKSRVDFLGDGYSNTLRIFDTKATTAQITTLLSDVDVVKAAYDLTSTDAAWSGASAEGGGKFDDFINRMAKAQAWGTIPDGVGDSGAAAGEKEASFTLFLETLYQYCLRAGITVISHEQAFDMALNTSYSPDNYFPNPDFETGPLTILASTNAPTFPDGWNGGAVITDTVDGGTENVLHIDNSGGGSSVTYFTRQYAVIPGGFALSFFALGTGTMIIKKIRNIHVLHESDGNSFEDWLSIDIDNVAWTEVLESDTIEDAAIIDYTTPVDAEELATQNYFKGYDNKVCGIHIELIIVAGDELKISKPEIVIS